MGASDPFYSTREWKVTRARHLRLYPLCAVCLAIGAPTPRKATQVDHVVSIRSGGARTDASNLRSLCQAHHSQKTIAVDGQHKGKKKFVITGADGYPMRYLPGEEP